MSNLIIEVILSSIIVYWTIYLSNFFVRNKKSRKFIVNHKIFHPNQISIFRVFLSFIAMFLFYYGMETLAVLLFVFSAILDATDWIIARWCNLQSELWKSLDPLADKIVYCVALLYFAFMSKINLYLVFVFIIIDILWQFSRILLDKLKMEKKANIYWKVKTSFVFILVFFLMVFESKWLFEIDVFYNNLLMIVWIAFAVLSIVFKFKKS